MHSAVAAVIDHTLLKPDATADDVRRICAEARQFGFASVCVNPYWVSLAKQELEGTAVKVCTVIGFPLGANRTAIKQAEALAALADGAEELDMVLNIGALKSGDLDMVEQDVQAIAETAHHGGAILKVILETCLLADDEKITAAKIAQRAGADFVKTSTGFAKSGATVADIALLRRTVGPDLGVKASGGIRSLADVQAMLTAGATRIGASAGVQIMQAEAAPAEHAY